jgi:hypothetical protein
MRNNLYLIQKYLIILIDRFNNKPISHKPVNKKTYVWVEFSIAFDKNSTRAMGGIKIKL